MCHTPDMTDDDIIPIFISAGIGGSESLALRFPPEYENQIADLLDEAGLDHSSAMAHSGLGEYADLAIESVKFLGSAGFGAAVASFYRTFAQRHQGKRIRFDENGTPVEFDGFPVKTVEQFVDKQVKLQAERDASMKRILDGED